MSRGRCLERTSAAELQIVTPSEPAPSTGLTTAWRRKGPRRVREGSEKVPRRRAGRPRLEALGCRRLDRVDEGLDVVVRVRQPLVHRVAARGPDRLALQVLVAPQLERLPRQRKRRAANKGRRELGMQRDARFGANQEVRDAHAPEGRQCARHTALVLNGNLPVYLKSGGDERLDAVGNRVGEDPAQPMACERGGDSEW